MQEGEEAAALAELASTSASGMTPPAGPSWRRGALPSLTHARDFERHLSVGRGGFTLHAATRAGAMDERGREALLEYVLRPPIAQERITRGPEGLVRIALKKHFSHGTVAVDLDPVSREEVVAACFARPDHDAGRVHRAALRARTPPRYPLTRFHGVLAPRAKLRPRVVPKLPDSAAKGCPSASSRNNHTGEPRGQAGERPPPRDTTGPIIPAAVPVSATTLARSIAGADVPMPNVLSTRHLARIGGGLLYAATSNVPWATLLARTFEIDIKACARCGGRLEVRAVVTDPDIARRILAAIPTTARAPPPIDSTVLYEPALA